MQFTKMHGCGNDYIYIDGAQEQVADQDKPELVRKLSHRHFGVGGDGVIFINPSTEADFEMEMYNMDGTRAEMCGNGIRCVAKFVYDKGLIQKTSIRVISCGQVKHLELQVEKNEVSTVRVNMGMPILKASEIPVISDTEEVIDQRIEVEDELYQVTCVSMGNPHAVVFVDDVDSFPLNGIGPYFENHLRFPKRINTEFIRVIDEQTIQMRVWERGTGETLACGTGACAAVVACALNHLTKDNVTVKLLGGNLQIQWDRETNQVYMTGPATTVFEGQINIEEII